MLINWMLILVEFELVLCHSGCKKLNQNSTADLLVYSLHPAMSKVFIKSLCDLKGLMGIEIILFYLKTQEPHWQIRTSTHTLPNVFTSHQLTWTRAYWHNMWWISGDVSHAGAALLVGLGVCLRQISSQQTWAPPARLEARSIFFGDMRLLLWVTMWQFIKLHFVPVAPHRDWLSPWDQLRICQNKNTLAKEFKSQLCPKISWRCLSISNWYSASGLCSFVCPAILWWKHPVISSAP